MGRPLNNLNGLGSEAYGPGRAGLRAKLYAKFTYKTSNYEKSVYGT